MASLPQLLASFLLGSVIGFIFFGGLWLTVQRVTTARRPGLLIAGSFVVRAAVALAGFILLMDGQWSRLLAGVAGFVVARIFILRQFGDVQNGGLKDPQDR